MATSTFPIPILTDPGETSAKSGSAAFPSVWHLLFTPINFGDACLAREKVRDTEAKPFVCPHQWWSFPRGNT
jgi:hypothetical protein